MFINATIVNDYTVHLFLNTTGYLTAYLALTVMIFPKHIYEKGEIWEGDGVFPNWTLVPWDVIFYAPKSPSDPILTGYGPFVIDYWQPQGPPYKINTIVLKRNSNYFLRSVDENGNILWEWNKLSPEYMDMYGAARVWRSL